METTSPEPSAGSAGGSGNLPSNLEGELPGSGSTGGTGGNTPLPTGPNCSEPTPSDCDGTCTNLGSDVDNCGACGNTCADPHGTVSCDLGVCNSACDPGWDDCSGDYTCETEIGGADLDNCGACGLVCNPSSATASCSAGACSITSCDYGYASCDGDDSTGCETQLMDVGDGLVGFWSLDESSGLVAADGSALSNDGSLINMAGDEWTAGAVNGALQFDGVDDYVSIGSTGAGVQTLSFWIRSDYVPSPVTNTGALLPSADGSPNGDWNNGSNAYAMDDASATATFIILGAAEHDWSAFDFGIPAGATIEGVEVEVRTRVSSVSLGSYTISLSWDGGSSYTATKSIPSGLLGTVDQVFNLGGPSDLWGHAWSVDEINDDFRLKANFTALGLGTAFIDYVAVNVTYLPYAGQKIMDVDGSAWIELIGGDLSATNFPATTEYYVDGASGTALGSGWHHVVITNSAGIDVSSLSLGQASNEYFLGALDEVRFYDRNLAASEIGFLSGDSSCP